MTSIKRNFLYSSFLTTANFLFPLITYPYISRVLGVTNIGICNFVDSIIHYFIILSMLGINTVGIREIAQNKTNKERLSSVFYSLFIINTITTIVAIFLLVVATLMVAQLREHWEMMLIGGIKLLFNYLIIEWFYRGLENFKYITIRSVIVRTAYVVSVFLFVRDCDDYTTYYFLTVLSIVINAVINIVYSRKFISIKWDKFQIRGYVKSYVIMGIYWILTSMYTTFNVSYLGFISGETEVGFYTTASKLFQILIALFTAFTGVMLPRMSAIISEGDQEKFKELLNKSCYLICSCSLPVILFSIIYTPNIVLLISGEGYEGAITPMRIIMPLMFIIGYEQIIIVQALTPLKKDSAILRNSILGAITGIALNILLVHTYKSTGSSISWLCSEIVVLMSAQYYIYKYIKFGFPWKMISKLIISYFPLIVCLLICLSGIPDKWLSFVISCLLSMLYFFVLNVYVLKDSELRPLILNSMKHFKDSKIRI